MKKIIFIIATFSSFNFLGQTNLTFLFSYDSTKIYIKYLDLKPFIKAENSKLCDLSKLVTKNDTIVLDRHFLYADQQKDSISFDLDKELFAALNNKKGTIIFNGQVITSFYTKKVKHRQYGEISFRGIYYFDKITKRHFLTETIYQKWYCIGTPSF
jgi:hypothetical protein